LTFDLSMTLGLIYPWNILVSLGRNYMQNLASIDEHFKK